MSKKNKPQPEMLQIRGWRQMWNDIMVKGTEEGLKSDQIKASLIEAFRKEIFGQMMFRLKVSDIELLGKVPETPENRQIVENIYRESLKKWKALVKECRQHLQTMNLIREDDLTLWDKEEEQEDDEDGGYEFCDAEDPEEEDIPESELPEKDLVPEEGGDFDGDAAVDGYSAVVEEIPVVPGAEFPAGYRTR